MYLSQIPIQQEIPFLNTNKLGYEVSIINNDTRKMLFIYTDMSGSTSRVLILDGIPSMIFII